MLRSKNRTSSAAGIPGRRAWAHRTGAVKIARGEPGAHVLPDGTIALSKKLLDDVHRASEARRDDR
jgi:hypothetical protein